MQLKYTNITFFVGGAQAVALEKGFIRESGVNYILVGESEHHIVRLVDYIMYKIGNIEEVPNLRYIDANGDYRETPEGELIYNLDDIPFPDYVYKSDDNLKIAGILTGRGCPFKCAFCYEGAKEKTVRYRSLDNVFEEISILLKNNKNIKIIQLYDDTFTLDVQRVYDFCDRFRQIRKIYKIGWICEIHCQTVYDKPELIRYMVESGLVEAQIGIESGNEEILQRLNKKITPEMIEKTVEHCCRAGLHMLEGNILLGGAGETMEQLELNFEFVERLINLGKGMLQIYPVMYWPFVKTPIALDPVKYGVKIISDQCEYTINCTSNCVSESNAVPRQEFVEHFDELTKRIEDIYRRSISKFTVNDAKKHWMDGSFSYTSQWGCLLSKYKYMNTYFWAKDKGAVDTLKDGIYPVRTFDVLSYKNNRLYLQETNILLNDFDSRILELCNGKNTGNDIASRLDVDISVVKERLAVLEDKMLIYGAIC